MLPKYSRVPKVRGPRLQLFPNTKDVGTGMGEPGVCMLGPFGSLWDNSSARPKLITNSLLI